MTCCAQHHKCTFAGDIDQNDPGAADMFRDEPLSIKPGIAAHSDPSLPFSDLRKISLFDLPQPGHAR